MKKMRKVMSLLLVLLMTVGLIAGCGTNETTSDGGEKGEAKSEDTITIGWAMAYFDHPVYQLLMQAAQEVADEMGDCEITFADGKNDATTQASQIDTFIAQDVDAIILTAAVSDPMLPSIKKINDAGIPLIIVDRRILPQGQDVTWDCYVTWDMVLSGTYGAEQTIEALGGAGKAAGKVVVVEGTAGAGSTIDRGGAYYSKLEEEPGVEVIYKVDGDFDLTKGM